ncbi:MAG: tryptophan synthase subunit alpha [Gemmatimonadetes bacterium]|nr:tryptophan synthase subunit alpha [Gemmatimonadota bacterium]
MQDRFAACAAEGRAALVLYTTAGFPQREQGLETLVALADAGADVIELGVPFSDPLADGPTIQRSSFDAIAQGVDLEWTLGLLARFRAARDTPVVIFTYLNPILDYGVERFLRDAAEMGANGVLVTDLPLGADPELEHAFESSPLSLIRLVAPTTQPARIANIAAAGSGFLYYVSRTGVTGAMSELTESLEREVSAVRSASPIPVAVGVGISTPEQAATVARLADGVIVGSALVEVLGREGIEGAVVFVRGLSAAIRGEARG